MGNGVLALINPILNDYILDLIAQGTPFIGTTTGTNTYTLNANQITGYDVGRHIIVRFADANTGAATLNINGYGAKSIRRNNNVALLSGDIVANSMHELVYDGTNFQILSQGSKLTALQMQTPLTGYSVGSNSALSTSDTMLNAFGKIQGQLNSKLTTAIKSKQTGSISVSSSSTSVSISTVISANSIGLIDGAGRVGIFSIDGVQYSNTHVLVPLSVNVNNTSITVSMSLPSGFSVTTPWHIQGNWIVLEFY